MNINMLKRQFRLKKLGYISHVFSQTLEQFYYEIKLCRASTFRSAPIMNPNSALGTDLDLKYKDAIFALNQLQTNATALAAIRNEQKNDPNSSQMRFEKNYQFLSRSGLSINDLDKLSVIHIAGTKGKGSTSAYCESILRHHGYKTGFFSSPHLISVRERIRLNGKPIETTLFLKYFWKVYDKLYESRTHDGDMPAYFQFLTLVAFHTYLEEGVDVAIMEVGIGGEYDTTNILRKVPVVGITSLGLDHQTILGETLPEIAWHKSGIMKHGCDAFSVKQPDNNTWNVLLDRSVERQCTLKLVPEFDEYALDVGWNREEFLKSLIEVQKLNISLAIQLAFAWMKRSDRKKLNLKTLTAIENCRWPGRTQIFETQIGKFYLDGAHTMESIDVCINWYQYKTKHETSEKVLIFNMTGSRYSEPYLRKLSTCKFNHVYFVPNLVDAIIDPKSDQTSFNNPDILQYTRCEQHLQIYKQIDDSCTVHVFPSVRHVLEHLGKNSQKVILVTGSLHLVGAVLRILDPKLELSNS